MRSNTEELLAAGIAPIGGKPDHSLQENPQARSNTLASDVIEIKIPAARTVRVAGKGSRHSPRVKAMIASVASPWP